MKNFSKSILQKKTHLQKLCFYKNVRIDYGSGFVQKLGFGHIHYSQYSVRLQRT